MGDRETTPIMPRESLAASTELWLWGVRVAASVSILILCIPPWRLWLVVREPCSFNNDYSLFTGPLLAMLPYLRVLWRLRRMDAGSVPGIKRGLMLAAPWGLVVLAPASFMAYVQSLNLDPLKTTQWELGAWAGLALMQALLLVAAVAAGSGMKPEPGDRKLRLKYVAKVIAFVFFLLVAASSSGPLLIRSRRAANDSAAVTSLRTINTAQITFSEGHPEKGFARTLAELGPAPGADLLDESIVNGERMGYRLRLIPGVQDAAGRVLHYTTTARPLIYETTGCRSFFSDETGVIRVTSQDRLATAQDPPLD